MTKNTKKKLDEAAMEILSDSHWVKIPLSRLVSANWNYKEDDAEKTQKLAENIKRNGQVENLLTRELPTGFYEVVNGNHRLEVFSILGLSEAVCFNLGKISDAQARRIAVETNETKFRRDDVKLASLIREIAADYGGEFSFAEMLTTMPFDEDQLRGLATMADFDWQGFQATNEAELQEIEKKRLEKVKVKMRFEVTCPSCGHKFITNNEEKEEEKG